MGKLRALQPQTEPKHNGQMNTGIRYISDIVREKSDKIKGIKLQEEGWQSRRSKPGWKGEDWQTMRRATCPEPYEGCEQFQGGLSFESKTLRDHHSLLSPGGHGGYQGQCRVRRLQQVLP